MLSTPNSGKTRTVRNASDLTRPGKYIIPLGERRTINAPDAGAIFAVCTYKKFSPGGPIAPGWWLTEIHKWFEGYASATHFIAPKKIKLASGRFVWSHPPKGVRAIQLVRVAPFKTYLVQLEWRPNERPEAKRPTSRLHRGGAYATAG